VSFLHATPKPAFLGRIKRYHLALRFHSEHGNDGITNYFWDRAFGTFYADPEGSPPDHKCFPRSETVLNLGYTGAKSARFPWAAVPSGLAPGSPVVRRGRSR
jgi:hypothetical protein